MKLNSAATLLIVLLSCSGHGQSTQGNRNPATPTVLRMKALQNQVASQQVEIDALRLRLGKLQEELQDLTQMVVDQETDAGSDDDASGDDSGAALLLAHSRGRQLRTNSIRNAQTRHPAWGGQKASICPSMAPATD